MRTPIAIVGRACILPGALTPEALWTLVSEGRDLVREVPAGRWGISPDDALCDPKTPRADRAWSDRGGYVEGFERVFDASGFDMPEAELASLDPTFHWVLHTARQALAQARRSRGSDRVGAVVGNLSFPSRAMADFAASVWLKGTDARINRVDPRNRFHSGLPALLLERALSLGNGVFALDAACASSLYAIKLACDRLQDGRADLMLAGAVNGADDLFIHIGFCALSAMSRTGQSRPFHREADGLVPAEGAGMIALKRLADAERDGDRIFGVVRGVGLSNDGRGRGFLVPSREGQVRSLRAAFQAAGLSPRDVSLLECHATGTAVGDATELDALRDVFCERDDALPIGSLKSNLGHLITTAGVAGVMKVLGALESAVRPATLHVDKPLDGIHGDAAFRLLSRAEPWDEPTSAADGLRRAGVSAFGFGGNNAHAIIEEYRARVPRIFVPRHVVANSAHVAIVGLGVVASKSANRDQFADRYFSNEPCLTLGDDGQREGRASSFDVDVGSHSVPPNDLRQTLPQQLLMLQAAREAAAEIGQMPRDTTGVFIGMGTDAEIARYGARWRLHALAGADAPWWDKARAALVSELSAAGVTGTMPNIVANRINRALELGGASCTVSSEERSGIDALEIGVTALASGELDAAIVGAVDLSCEPVHTEAMRAVFGAACPPPGDAAVALVLKRLTDAERDGDRVYAVIDGMTGEATSLRGVPSISVDREPPCELSARFGHAHAASGLLHVAAAALSLSDQRYPSGRPWEEQCPRIATVRVPAIDGAVTRVVRLRAHLTSLRTQRSAAKRISGDSERKGVWLTLAAHPLPVRLPPREAQLMRSAPALPSALTDSAFQSVHKPRAAPQDPSVRVSTHAILAASSTSDGLGLTRGFVNLSRTHAAFVKQQAEVHQRFLTLSEQLTAAVFAMSTPAHSQISLRNAEPTPGPAQAPVQCSGTEKLAPTPREQLPMPNGLVLARLQLEIFASGLISEVYGPLFAQQDGYERQVRMPEPPLLLADRVTGIDATPGIMGRGTIWTETDIRNDSWYVFRGRMPAGIMIESGQADLMLISYMGADFLNKGDRAYRLLGCRLTFEGDLPRPGDTLRYDIHVDGHAQQDDVRLFFFHYDCRVNDCIRLSVRSGQAGFFTDEELANSAGVLWNAEEQELRRDPRVDEGDRVTTRRSFSADDVRAFAAGRPRDCFGEGFEAAESHVDTPSIQGGRMLFLDKVTQFEPKGGPWGRGYLRAETPVCADDWFFAGHFKNDPCMPGTLMFEGCIQALSFYLAALGFTLKRDGWRFQPVVGEPIEMRCRGQVTPSSKSLVYEVFIEEIIAGPVPTVYADLLCTVDGRKAFHARRVGWSLVPDWPLESAPALLESHVEPKPVAEIALADGSAFKLGYDSLLACAWGKPSRAFGPMYERFDSARNVPRLPGPPYHFVSRVVRVDAEAGLPKKDARAELEYDIPADAWYFDENGSRTVPYCVLLESALQPCGWLASYVGCALAEESDVKFRNLDGTATQHAELWDDVGTLRTEVHLKSLSRSAGMTLVGFHVECFAAERRIFSMETVFGFFPPEALESQIGLPVTPAQRAAVVSDVGYFRDLSSRAGAYYEGTARLPGSRLDMLDRITAFERNGGAAGIGWMCAEKEVRAQDWYFKSHFFQDPVQPGSLGIEAMIQLLQLFMLESGLHEAIKDPRFEPIAIGHALSWKYRGQVVPSNNRVVVTLDVTEVGRDDAGVFAMATSSLWADGIRIYEAKGLGMRIVSGSPTKGAKKPLRSSAVTEMLTRDPPPAAAAVEILDPAIDTWLGDHCPTYARPALPMMCVVDRLAAAIDGPICALLDVQIKGWIDFVGPRQFRTRVVKVGTKESRVTLFADDVEVASARVCLGHSPAPPDPWPAVKGKKIDDPYDSAALFHGPAFQLLRSASINEIGASSELDASVVTVPIGRLHPALLDAALHAIPHDALHTWAPLIGRDRVGYPVRIPRFEIFGHIPTHGLVRCEVRFDGFLFEPDLPRFQIQLIGPQGAFVCFEVIEACFPKGKLGQVERRSRRAFLRDRAYVKQVSLSRQTDGTTRLSATEVADSNWMPGTIEAIYGTTDPGTIAIHEHVAAREAIHPGLLPDALPLTRPCVDVRRDGEDIVVSDAPPNRARLDLSPLNAFWDAQLGLSGDFVGRDLWEGLIQRFVRRVVIVEPKNFESLRTRGAIFLANHQVQLESLLITNILAGLTGRPVVTLANAKHEHRWIGWILRALFSAPGCVDPKAIRYFDPSRPDAMFGILSELRPALQSGAKSFFLHPQGTRSRSAQESVTRVSSTFLDLAIELDLPIVPVRFIGGLPVQPIDGKLEFPYRFGQQDYVIGSAIEPDMLRQVSYAKRKGVVCDAINALGIAACDEVPHPPDLDFEAAVGEWSARTGASDVESAFYRTLEASTTVGDQTRRLVEGARSGLLEIDATDRDRWLGEFARRLYGPKGASIRMRES